MGIKLTLDVESPLTHEEAEQLAGISVMLHAIASRQLDPETPDGTSQPEADAVAGPQEHADRAGLH